MAQRELTLHYQPMVETRSGACRRVEALLRWTHPTYGVIDVRDVLRLARVTDRLRDLAVWCAGEAARQRTAWSGDGLQLDVSLNLTGDELDDDTLGTLMRALSVAGARPSGFTFDVPASRVLRGDIWPGLRRLAASGARIAIDDVSAADLMTPAIAVDIDEIKIARALVRRAVADAQARRAVRSLIEAARDLGVASIAVGIDDATTADLFAELGCDLIQGYRASRPLAAVDIARWRGLAARVVFSGTAAVTTFAAIARAPEAASVTRPVSNLTGDPTCCSLRASIATADVGVGLREVPVENASLRVESSLTADDARRLRDAVERDITAVEGMLGSRFDRAPVIYVLATRASFSLALQRGFGQGATHAAALAAANGGVAFADPSAIVLSWESVRDDRSLAIVRHELIHVLAHQIAGVNSDLPSWFDEGLATLAEREVAPDPLRDAREASAVMELLRRGRVSLRELAAPRDWTVRNAQLGGRGYAVAAEAVRVLQSSLGAGGTAALLTQTRAIGFERALADVTGVSTADFSLAFPARFAVLNGGPMISQRSSSEGVTWSASGFAARAPLHVVIEGSGYRVEFEAVADQDGTYRALFGGTAPAGIYRVTVASGDLTASASLRCS